MDTEMSISERYWRLSLYEMDAALGHHPLIAPELAPPPVKLYPDAARHQLASRIPRRLEAAGPSNVDTLSTLLYYTYGYGRADVTATDLTLHRLVPSARCLYPAELYVWVPPDDSAPAGLHYYDPAHHSLVTLRPGIDSSMLASAVPADLAGAAYVLVVTALFWKVAHRYGDYGYRLCTQEVGVVVGNVLAVAAAMGLRGHVHHQFVDEPVRRWLDLTAGEESPMVLVPLYSSRDSSRECVHPTVNGSSVDAAGPIWRRSSPLDQRVCAPFLELDAASRFTTTTQIASPPERGPQRPAGHAVSTPPAPADEPIADLVAALRGRASGPAYFNASGLPVPAEVLWCVCRYAQSPHVSDAAAPGQLAVGMMVAVNRVTGVAPGSYAVLPDGALEQVRAGPVADPLARAAGHPFTVNFETANVVVSIVGDPAATAHWLGDRGYRVLNAEAGIVAQRVCLASAAAGLVARPYNSYRAEAVAELLGISGTGLVPIFQIAVGRPRVTGTVSLPMAP